MKLYYSPGACSMSPHIVLNELGKKFETEAVDLGKKVTATGKDYFKINPKGAVPALEIKAGEVLTEGAVIVQYLADKAKNTKILPKTGTMARVRVQEMLNYISAEVHKNFSPLFNKSMSEETRKMMMDRLTKQLDHVNNLLSQSKFIVGKSFTVADAYLFTVLNWSNWLGIDLKKWPHLADYVQRIAARPSVQKTMKEEGLAG